MMVTALESPQRVAPSHLKHRSRNIPKMETKIGHWNQVNVMSPSCEETLDWAILPTRLCAREQNLPLARKGVVMEFCLKEYL